MGLKKDIEKNINKHGKTEEIDVYWIDEAVYILGKLRDARSLMNKHGMYQETQSGYTQKNAYFQSYESLLKSFATISAKLGMSPKDREKWIKEEEETQNPLIK